MFYTNDVNHALTLNVITLTKDCGRLYPKYAIAAVGCVLVKNNSILLIKRGYAPRPGVWAVPGGAIEAGETIDEAAKRELEEETGIVAEPLGIIGVFNAITRDELGKVQYHYVIIDVLFDSNTIKGNLRAGGDAIDVAWIPLEEVIKRDDVTKTTKKLVEKILNKDLNYVPF